MNIRIGFLLLGLLMLLGFGRMQTTIQASPITNPQPAPRSDLEMVEPLTIVPSNPAVGQTVTARFVVRNNSSDRVQLAKLGAGGRGPNCADWSCSGFSDFPLRETIGIAPQQTYVYEESRSFTAEGTYFAQPVYQSQSGTWFFTGNRVDFSVSSTLRITQPLQFDTSTATQHKLVFASYTLRNDGSDPISFQAVGIGVRGPGCAYLDWRCRHIRDFPFENAVTLQPGQTWTYNNWRAFTETGSHFAQITVQDNAGVWRQLGEPMQFDVSMPMPTPRLTPYKLGVHYHPRWNAEDGPRLALARQAGADLVRIAVSWRLIEPTAKGVWETAWYLPAVDNVISEANRLGLQVLVMVQDVPCWASSDPNKNCSAESWNPRYPPSNSHDYADALRKLVQLHGPQVVAWEIWNEPNDPRFWQPEPNAVVYSELLKTAYNAIKAENSSEIVLGGSLAGADMEFLLTMYANGVKGHFDGLALHPYSGTAAPDDCPNLRSSYGCGVESIRDMMVHRGDGKPIWLTEFGWSGYGGYGGVGEAAHLAHMQTALAMLDNWDYVPVATWYNLIDTTSASGALTFENHMGWYKPNLTPKNSAEWLQSRVIDPATLTEKIYLPLLEK